MKVAAIGRSEMLYNSISVVQEHGHEIVAIITCKESPGYRITTRDFELMAKKLGVEFILTEKINSSDIIDLLKGKNPEIGISVNWKTIIGQRFINCFPNGIINAHAGDLPRYRGNAVPNWAIINGEKKVVLSLHLMTVELDAGPIVLKKHFTMTDKTYISEVYEFINNNLPEMFLKAVKGFSNKTIKQKNQPDDPSVSLRCYPRIPKDGEIDWNLSAIQLDRLVRAVSEPFDGAYTFFENQKLIVWKAHEEPLLYPVIGIPGQVTERRSETGEVIVLTGEGFLVLEEIEIIGEGKKKANEIIKTMRTRLGMDITGELSRLHEEVERFKKFLKINEQTTHLLYHYLYVL